MESEGFMPEIQIQGGFRELIQFFIVEFEKGPGRVKSQKSVCETKAKQI